MSDQVSKARLVNLSIPGVRESGGLMWPCHTVGINQRYNLFPSAHVILSPDLNEDSIVQIVGRAPLAAVEASLRSFFLRSYRQADLARIEIGTDLGSHLYFEGSVRGLRMSTDGSGPKVYLNLHNRYDRLYTLDFSIYARYAYTITDTEILSDYSSFERHSKNPNSLAAFILDVCQRLIVSEFLTGGANSAVHSEDYANFRAATHENNVLVYETLLTPLLEKSIPHTYFPGIRLGKDPLLREYIVNTLARQIQGGDLFTAVMTLMEDFYMHLEFPITVPDAVPFFRPVNQHEEPVKNLVFPSTEYGYTQNPKEDLPLRQVVMIAREGEGYFTPITDRIGADTTFDSRMEWSNIARISNGRDVSGHLAAAWPEKVSSSVFQSGRLDVQLAPPWLRPYEYEVSINPDSDPAEQAAVVDEMAAAHLQGKPNTGSALIALRELRNALLNEDAMGVAYWSGVAADVVTRTEVYLTTMTLRLLAKLHFTAHWLRGSRIEGKRTVLSGDADAGHRYAVMDKYGNRLWSGYLMEARHLIHLDQSHGMASTTYMYDFVEYEDALPDLDTDAEIGQNYIHKGDTLTDADLTQ